MKSYPDAQIIVTGHILGGALAVLAAAEIQIKFKNFQHLYRFGQPKVGNKQFAEFINGLIPSYYRMINQDDAVPHVPSVNYMHGRIKSHYDSR